MKEVKIVLLNNKLNKKFFCIFVYETFIFKQPLVKDDLLYSFFLVINFLYKYGFFKIK